MVTLCGHLTWRLIHNGHRMPSVLALLFLASRGGVLKYHFLNFDLCIIALLAVVYPNTDWQIKKTQSWIESEFLTLMFRTVCPEIAKICSQRLLSFPYAPSCSKPFLFKIICCQCEMLFIWNVFDILVSILNHSRW